MFTDSEAKFIKWFDYLWLLVPIAGIAIMVCAVIDRKDRETSR